METRFRVFFVIALYVWVFLAAGCAQPLGPGFRFARRQVDIRVPSDAPQQLHVRVVDYLNNIGNLPLRSLEVRMPSEIEFGAQNLQTRIEGKEVSLDRGSNADPQLMRMAFDPPWEQMQLREIVTEWDLASRSSTRGTTGLSAEGFYIAEKNALPLWQPPSGVFTKGDATPEDGTLTVVVPSDYRVLVPGKHLKRSAEGNLVAQRYHLDPDKEFPPYVVAGRYQEQIIGTSHGAVSFWTFSPLDGRVAETAAMRLSSSMQAFTDFFGPVRKGKPVVQVVEAPGELPDEFGGKNDPGGTSFPKGVLLSPRAVAQGIANEANLQLEEYELAQTWFGWRVRPREEAQVLMGRGLGLFALVIAAEARGQDQRDLTIKSLLERYEEASHAAADGKIVKSQGGDPREERITSGYKAALFFVALEDSCGHDNLRVALQNVVRARGGDEAGYEELRAAAESASRRDLAEIFRAWLSRSGIPDDFRARYGPAPSLRIQN